MKAERVDFAVPGPLHEQTVMIAAALGLEPGDFMLHALRAAVDAALGDRDVRLAVQAMARIRERDRAAPEKLKRRIREAAAANEHPPDGSASAPAEHPSAGAGAGPDGAGEEPPSAEEGSAPAAPDSPAQAEPGPAAEAPAPPRATARRRAPGEPPKRRGPAQELSAEERRKAGSIVRRARIARHLTQQQVAAELGMPGQTISAVEVGRIGNGASATRARIVLEWAQRPHPADDAPPPSTPEPGKGRGHGIQLGKRRPLAPDDRPAPDWRPRIEPTPMVLPPGLELLACPALRARITERACAQNQARAKGDLALQDYCPSCPGVVALAVARRAAPRSRDGAAAHGRGRVSA